MSQISLHRPIVVGRSSPRTRIEPGAIIAGVFFLLVLAGMLTLTWHAASQMDAATLATIIIE